MTNGYGYVASKEFCNAFTDGVLGATGTVWDSIKRASLTTGTIVLGPGEPNNKVAALDYADQEILADSWLTNPGTPTGSIGDSLISLTKHIIFPIASTAWGEIYEIYFSTDYPFTSALVTFAGPIDPRPTVGIGDQLVFLGSPVWGSGDVTLTISYT